MPVINDTDNFSEVSLDRDGNSSEVGHTDLLTANESIPFYASPLSELDSYNNLQSLQDLPPPTLDINSNDQQQQFESDGSFNPISAAFGSAASTVFSTFSSIIKGSTSQAKFEDEQPLQQIQSPISSTIDANDSSSLYQDPNNPIMNNQYGFNLLQADVNAVLPPPSFFSPDEDMLQSSYKKQNAEMPSNAFRLGGAKKKTYAHIPGLSSNNTQNVPQNFNLNPVMPPLPAQPVIHAESTANFQQPTPNFYDNAEPKSQPQQQQSIANKFSFSSLLDKIPVTKTLFGSAVVAEQINSNEYVSNNDFNQTSAVFQQPLAPPQVETINYFMPQTQANEQQVSNQTQVNNNNYFATQNFSSVTTEMVSVQKPDVIPSKNAPAAATVNFFNPQQFNTNPFAKVQQPTSATVTAVAASSSFPSSDIYATTTMNNENTGKNDAILPPTSSSSEVQNVFINNQFVAPPTLQAPSMQNEIIQPQQTSFQFTPQSYSTPPSNVINNNLSQQQSTVDTPIFFNPNQASDLFNKSRVSSGDGKSKNPYSNTRMRGVYRAAYTSSPNDSSAPSSNLTTLPSLSPQFFTPTAPVFQESIDQTKNLSSSSSPRPPSIPPIEQNTLTGAVSSVIGTTSVIQSNVVDAQETVMQQTTSELTPPPTIIIQPQQIQKKSDLNVPESENLIPFEQEQSQQQESAFQMSQNVSNFFSCDNNDKVNEQVSALNFFQVQPEMTSAQPVLATQPQQTQQQQQQEEELDDSLQSNSLSAINFFNVDQADSDQRVPKSENESIQSCEKEEFNSPITSSTIQCNDTLNDVTDKMESLSACSRSTLSLFATSELDSTMSAKHSAPLQSLIPKYLEQQPPIGTNLKSESLVNESQNQKYRPTYCHWFYQNLYWHPFSMSDSLAIEHGMANDDEIVLTSGGRYEVNIKDKRRSSIYWTSGSNVIRKCSWFYRDSLNGNHILLPYDESTADFLEKEYEKAMINDAWNHRIYLPESSDYVVMRNLTSIEHHKMGQSLVVKRGVDEFDIDDGEEGSADHLILCVSNFGDKIDDNGNLFN